MIKPSDILIKALELFGPNGERWIQGSFHRRVRVKTDNGYATKDNYCMLGALNKAAGTRTKGWEAQQTAKEILDKTIPGINQHIIQFNDAGGRGFKSIKAVMCKAIKHAVDMEHKEQ